MRRLMLPAIAIIVILCAYWLIPTGRNDNGRRDESTQRQAPQPSQPVPYPPGEYVTASSTAAAIDAETLALAIKALDRKDIRSVHILRDQGRAFLLPKGTRIALLPAGLDEGVTLSTAVTDTVDGADICTGTVESGDRIGTTVAIPCGTVKPAK